MRIAVNTRLLVSNKLDGIGYYAHEVLQRLVTEHPTVQFYFLFDRTPNPNFIYGNNVTPVILSPQARHPILYFIWFHLRVRWWLKKNKPDVFYSPEGYLPPRDTTPLVNVIHDLNFEHFPDSLPKAERFYYQHFFPKYASWSDHIITVSDFSKQDIVKRYRISESKISTIYNGIRKVFNASEKPALFTEKYTKGKPFFLHVGTLHPRKNIEGIVSAFNLYRKLKEVPDTKLVLAGRKKWWSESMENAVKNSPFSKDIIFTDRLETEELVSAYQSAIGTLVLSHFEGFGLPIVEAMSCGCPVIAANNSALSEIGEEAAIMVDQNNAEEVAHQMHQLSMDSKFRSRVVKRGLEKCQQFSWDLASKFTWEIIKNTAKNA
ncbi:glycosyltransferase family 4 protein [Luteibaculum oceani]|uniref:glycosyltransferase family 4 protein n=1 Tax=Luteibaculum oceani TaxID=1294296 RepID=UPI0014776351|nr:glycosyltransferase family 1 protein [Luteibaculum oceani]